MKEIFLKTKDNVKIALNHYENGNDSVVVLVHGWFMTKDSKAFANISECFSKKFDVLTLDCRGHGRSSGFYTFTSKEIIDVEAVVEFAKTKYKKIYLAGFSLGGSLVILHAALKNDVDKIIAVSAPTSFEKIENQMWHPNAWIPTLQKFELKRWISVRPSLIPHRKIKPIDVIEKIKVPSLFVAGARDKTVKPWHTQKLFESALCKKRYELFENCIHAEDIFIEEKDRFVEVCFNWLENS